MADLSLRKTVIFIIPILHYGGAERVLHEIVENLSPKYFKCHIISFESTAECPFKFNRQTKLHFLYPNKLAPIEALPAVKKNGFIKKILRLKKLLNSFPQNAILVPFLARPTTAYTVLAQIGSKRRIFASLHTTESEYIKFNYQSAPRRKLEIFLLKLACWGSDKIIAASKGVKKDLIDNFSVPSTKIQVIDNPIDLAKIGRMTSEPPPVMFDDNSTKSIFLHIGRLSAEKNHLLLIKAAAILRNSALDFVILIAGSGDQEIKIRNWIHAEQLQDHVAMLGNVENPYALMARARALVLTSHYESSPMVLKEAMASGTAVISVDCPHGPGDILKKGIYGLLVPPDDPKALSDAMLAVARNDRLYNDLVQKGLSRAGRFDIGNIVNQWKDLFLQAG